MHVESAPWPRGLVLHVVPLVPPVVVPRGAAESLSGWRCFRAFFMLANLDSGKLARGAAPSMVCANLQDAFALLTPGTEIPAACGSHIHQLRGECVQ